MGNETVGVNAGTVRAFVKALRAAGVDVACVRGEGQVFGTPTANREVPPIPGVHGQGDVAVVASVPIPRSGKRR